MLFFCHQRYTSSPPSTMGVSRGTTLTPDLSQINSGIRKSSGTLVARKELRFRCGLEPVMHSTGVGPLHPNQFTNNMEKLPRRDLPPGQEAVPRALRAAPTLPFFHINGKRFSIKSLSLFPSSNAAISLPKPPPRTGQTDPKPCGPSPTHASDSRSRHERRLWKRPTQ